MTRSHPSPPPKCVQVEAHVQRVNRDPDGELLSYDLTARAQAGIRFGGRVRARCTACLRLVREAEIARVKDASTAEDASEPHVDWDAAMLKETQDSQEVLRLSHECDVTSKNLRPAPAVRHLQL